MEQNNTYIFISIALAVGLVTGYFFGGQGTREAEKTIQDLTTSLNIFVPPLPDVINTLGGKITAVNGETFTLEIPSLTDRYPKPDRSQATETKTIRVTSETTLTETSFDPKTFENGLPQQITIKSSDLKEGDLVSVTVSENARTDQNLTAVSINRSSGI